VVCPDSAIEKVVAAMRAAHSYEEPAYDVYPLRPERAAVGKGRLGLLPAPVPLGEFARAVKDALQTSCVQMVGSPQRSVQRVAVGCGAAGEFLEDAGAAKADVFLTGEARFHDCLAAEAQNVALVLPGHYATERVGIEALAKRLQGPFPDMQIWAGRRDAD